MNYVLENMPHVNESMERVLDWYENKFVDRVPVRFSGHNSRHNIDMKKILADYDSIKDFWYDAQRQVDLFEKDLEGKTCYGDTFPVFYPNLGPCVYSSYYGLNVEFGDVTSWAKHCVNDINEVDFSKFKLDTNCESFKKIDELTDIALKQGKGKYFVGYTDLHPSLDSVADFMGPENLCVALYDESEKVKAFAQKMFDDFEFVMDYYEKKLKGNPSVTWMGIPTEERMHIPSCDFSAMLSTDLYNEFGLQLTKKEVKIAKYNIFHLDGAGVAKHLDELLKIDEIQAIQWVQGVGEDEPIMQWVPLIKKIQAANKGVVVGLKPQELKQFMNEVSPKGIYLTMNAAYEDQPALLKEIESWT